jgi:hypothetical protein
MRNCIVTRTTLCLFFILAGKNLASQDFALMPAGPEDTGRFRVGTINDGYLGFGAAREYDDLRSYGLSCEYFLTDRFSFSFLWSGITQRGVAGGNETDDDRWTEATPESARFDRIDLTGSWVWFRMPLGPGTALLALEGGLSLDGRLGGLEIQKLVHLAGAVDRPVPERYLDPRFLAAAGVRSGWTAGKRYPLVLSAGFSLDTLLQPKADLRFLVWDGSRESRLFIGLQYVATADGNTDSQRRFLNAHEEGLNLSFGFSGTHFYLFQNVNILSREGFFDRTFQSAGGIGFQTAATTDGPGREGNLSVETALLSQRGVQTLIYLQPSWYLPLYPPLTHRSGFWILTGNGNNAPKLDGSNADWRMQVWSAGLRISLWPPRERRLPDLYLDAGLGLKWKLGYSIDRYRAMPENEVFLPFIDLRCGLELPLPLPVGKGRNRYGFQLFYGFQPVLGPDGPDPGNIPVHGLGLALTIRDQGFKEAPAP